MGFVGFGGALWFVVASELFAPVLNHFFFFAAALSTRFGYGRPAFSARALASAFCDGVNGVDFLFGFFVSQKSFFFFISSPPNILSPVGHRVHLTLHHTVDQVLGRCCGCQWWL